MIPNQWHAVLESREVLHGDVVGVMRIGEELIQADRPIVAYRVRRQVPIDGASEVAMPSPST